MEDNTKVQIKMLILFLFDKPIVDKSEKDKIEVDSLVDMIYDMFIIKKSIFFDHGHSSLSYNWKLMSHVQYSVSNPLKEKKKKKVYSGIQRYNIANELVVSTIDISNQSRMDEIRDLHEKILECEGITN